jgi:hypothetical protein
MTELTRDELLDKLQASQDQIVRLLESMVGVQDWQPEPVEWSFRLIAAHLATAECKCHLRRVRSIAAGDTPQLDNYTNVGADFAAQDLRDSLAAWVATRQQLIAFVRDLSAPQLSYVGLHEAVGPMTVLDALQELLDQDQGNLRHVYQLILAYLEDQADQQKALDPCV